MPINIDLTTLSGWDGLSSGTHTITIKAKASGYRDSNASAGVSVTKQITLTPLCFTALQAGSIIQYSKSSLVDASGIQKSTDGENWTSWNGSSITLTNVGDKVYIRNTNNTLSVDGSNCFQFGMAGLIKASGNIMSLINYADLSYGCFQMLFYEISALADISELYLPAETLSEYCYSNMFRGCTTIEHCAVMSNVTTTARNCCRYMYAECTSLVDTCELTASVLEPYAYYGMFFYDNSLASHEPIQATSFGEYCCNEMFVNTSLVSLPPLVVNSFSEASFLSMYRHSRLITTPPIITIASGVVAGNASFYNMFWSCSSLKVSLTQGTPFITTPAQYDYANAFTQFLRGTGGEYVGNPEPNTTLYYYL